MELQRSSEKIKVSIIIPAYNLEAYIDTTLQSCLDQTYHNLEIIVVNDGSTDNTEKIITKYLKDKRIKLYNQVNSGVSAARNNGIKLATGDYITFLDGDDTLTQDTIESLIELVVNPKFDYNWIFFPVVRILENGEEMLEISKDLMPSYKYSNPQSLSCKNAFDLMQARKLPMCVGAVFYKKDFIEPKFIKGRFEDTYFIMDLLAKENPIYISNKGCYRYLNRADSFINSKWTPEKWIDYVRVKIKTLDTELKLFPEREDKIKQNLTAIRYNLLYLKHKNHSDHTFSKPLIFFNEHVEKLPFNFKQWLTMIIKSLISRIK